MTQPALRLEEWPPADAARRRALLARPAPMGDPSRRDAVRRVLERVKAEGDAALRALTLEYDGIALDTIAVNSAEIERAAGRLTARQREAIDAAATQIERFHAAQQPRSVRVETTAGVQCERVHRPLQRVGLYVPAGSAPLPSTALMLGIPARLAGCPVRVLCSPPRGEQADVDPGVLYAARLCGIEQIFKLGGAQAIAAMAYGTRTVPKVDKVFGPGNAWVTEAKAQVARDPAGAAQDLPAGPSEVMVVTDANANPAFAAADLLSQAEHGPDSQVVLVSTDANVADAVITQVERQKARLTRVDVVERALRQARVFLVADRAAAIDLVNDYAPEHLILQVENPRLWLAHVYAAGSVFLGPWAPESVGDYCSGTNHVLPTYGFARAYSSLGLADFQRAMTVQELTPAGLSTIGPIAEVLAEMEGLDAHGAAVRLRLDEIERGNAS